MMMPNRPMALPKISMIRILTKSEELAASATAAPEPTYNSLQDYKTEPSLFYTVPAPTFDKFRFKFRLCI
jgi:hypothetical protein